MKAIKYILISLTLLVVIACAHRDIPQKAQTFLDKYFPKSSIVLTEIAVEENVLEYEVWLNDGTKVEFDMQGNWRRVARKKSGVPVEMIPAPIMQFIHENYPGNVVTKYSWKDYGYKIELSDDMDLRFNKQYKFIEEVD